MDSIEDRIWDREQLEEARQQHMPRHAIDWGRGPARGTILASTGAGTVPVDMQQVTQEETRLCWRYVDPQAPHTNVQTEDEMELPEQARERKFFTRDNGRIFVDGSCLSPASKKVARGSWACAQIDPDGATMAATTGIMFKGIDQTASNGKSVGMTMARFNAEQGAALAGDCQSVIANFNKPYGVVAAPDKKNGGQWRAIQHELGHWREQWAIEKIKAHRNLQDITDPRELWMAKSNDVADTLAKKAAQRHRLGAEAGEAASKALKFHREVALAMGRLLPSLPATRDLYHAEGAPEAERAAETNEDEADIEAGFELWGPWP